MPASSDLDTKRAKKVTNVKEAVKVFKEILNDEIITDAFGTNLNVVSVMCGSGKDHNTQGFPFDEDRPLYKFGNYTWFGLDPHGNIQIVTDGPGIGDMGIGRATGQHPTPDEMKDEQMALLAAFQRARLQVNMLKNKKIGLAAMPLTPPGLFVYGFSRGGVAVHKFTLEDNIGTANSEWFDENNRSVLLIDPVAGRPENAGKEHLVSPHIHVLYIKSLLMDLYTYAIGFGPTAPVVDPKNEENPLGEMTMAGVLARHGSDQAISSDPERIKEAAQDLHQKIVDVMFKDAHLHPKKKIEKIFKAYQERHKIGMYCAIQGAFQQFQNDFNVSSLNLFKKKTSSTYSLVQTWKKNNPGKEAPKSIEDLLASAGGKAILIKLARSTAKGFINRDERRRKHALADITKFADMYIAYHKSERSAGRDGAFEQMIAPENRLRDNNPMSPEVLINNQFLQQVEEMHAIQSSLGNPTWIDAFKTTGLRGIQAAVVGGHATASAAYQAASYTTQAASYATQVAYDTMGTLGKAAKSLLFSDHRPRQDQSQEPSPGAQLPLQASDNEKNGADKHTKKRS